MKPAVIVFVAAVALDLPMLSKEHGAVVGVVMLLDYWLYGPEQRRFPAGLWVALAIVTVAFAAAWFAIGRAGARDVAAVFIGRDTVGRLAVALPAAVAALTPHLNAAHALYLLGLGDTTPAAPRVGRARATRPEERVGLRAQFLLDLARWDRRGALAVADSTRSLRPARQFAKSRTRATFLRSRVSRSRCLKSFSYNALLASYRCGARFVLVRSSET